MLANDLVGNTFWIKLVDISVRTHIEGADYPKADARQPANRGVIWDQEIYDTFSYNQDRTFFHTLLVFSLYDLFAMVAN